MDAVNTQAPDRDLQLKYGISYVADLANGKTVDVLMLHGLNRVRDKFIPYGMCGDGKPVAMIFAKLQAHYSFRHANSTPTDVDRIFVVPGGFHVQQLLLEIFGGCVFRKACHLDNLLYDIGRKTQVKLVLHCTYYFYIMTLSGSL